MMVRPLGVYCRVEKPQRGPECFIKPYTASTATEGLANQGLRPNRIRPSVDQRLRIIKPGFGMVQMFTCMLSWKPSACARTCLRLVLFSSS